MPIDCVADELTTIIQKWPRMPCPPRRLVQPVVLLDREVEVLRARGVVHGDLPDVPELLADGPHMII